PPLAVLSVRWFNDADIDFYFPAAAAACLQLLIVIGALGVWRLAEPVARVTVRAWIAGGLRRSFMTRVTHVAFALAVGAFALSTLAIAGMALWSVAAQWRFPDALPDGWTLANWARELASLVDPVRWTVPRAIAATLIAL